MDIIDFMCLVVEIHGQVLFIFKPVGNATLILRVSYVAKVCKKFKKINMDRLLIYLPVKSQKRTRLFKNLHK